MMTETAHAGEQIAIGPMERPEQRTVADLLARAMRDNPSSVGMFGPDPDRRLRSLRTLYTMLLSDIAQPPLVARWGSLLVGAAVMSPPETCFFRRSRAREYRIRIAGRDVTIESPAVSWRHLPALLHLGLPALNRAAVMAHSSTVHDPEARHWHIELVGVEPERQGQAIGGKLMEASLRLTEAADEPAYLETDTPANVAFYQRRGFEVTAQEEPLGVPIWYMTRPCASDE